MLPSNAVQVLMLTYSNALGVTLRQTPSLLSSDGEMRNFVLQLPVPSITLNMLEIHMFMLAGRHPALKRIHCAALLVKTQNLCVNILQLPPWHNTKIQGMYSGRHDEERESPGELKAPAAQGDPWRDAQKNRIREKAGLQGERE